MPIANSITELRAIERRRQELKDKKWKEGYQSWADKKEKSKLNLDANRTKSLRRYI